MEFLQFSANKPTFQEWLKTKTAKTPAELMELALATGSWKEAQAMMNWYRYRYRYEMELRDMYMMNNPFKEDE